MQIFVELVTWLKRDAGLALCISYNNILTVRILAVSMQICRFPCQVSCMLISRVSVFYEFLKLVRSELESILHFLVVLIHLLELLQFLPSEL